MKLGIPQLIMLAFLFMNLGMHLIKDGEKKNEYYNFVASLIATIIEIFILYKGGFF